MKKFNLKTILKKFKGKQVKEKIKIYSKLEENPELVGRYLELEKEFRSKVDISAAFVVLICTGAIGLSQIDSMGARREISLSISFILLMLMFYKIIIIVSIKRDFVEIEKLLKIEGCYKNRICGDAMIFFLLIFLLIAGVNILLNWVGK
ncbi:hypothetical protein F350042L8_08690 [Fusobacterium ulcerans]|uniref:hypothetical protein n=1 Tax=Fusobacterium ulcerans TaxID=861 RepID=UPI0034B94069